MTTCNHSGEKGHGAEFTWCQDCGAISLGVPPGKGWLLPNSVEEEVEEENVATLMHDMHQFGKPLDDSAVRLTGLLRDQFAESLSVRVKKSATGPDVLQIDLPFVHPDGDRFCIYVEGTPNPEMVRVSDKATTSMRISFHSNDSEPAMVKKIVNQNGCEYDDGEIFTVGQASDLLKSVFRLAVAMAKVEEAGEWVNGTRGFKAETIG